MNIIIKSTVVDAAKNKLISAKTKNFLKQNHITLPNDVSAKRQKKVFPERTVSMSALKSVIFRVIFCTRATNSTRTADILIA